MIYITICSLAGSITVTSSKAFGIALKLTFEGNNQFTHLPTYIFMIVTAGTILLQMKYLNMALDLYSPAVVTPIYYVFFSTATITASMILFQGIYGADTIQVVSMIIGFIIIFLGVLLINKAKQENALERRSSIAEAGLRGGLEMSVSRSNIHSLANERSRKEDLRPLDLQDRDTGFETDSDDSDIQRANNSDTRIEINRMI